MFLQQLNVIRLQMNTVGLGNQFFRHPRGLVLSVAEGLISRGYIPSNAGWHLAHHAVLSVKADAGVRFDRTLYSSIARHFRLAARVVSNAALGLGQPLPAG